MWGVSLFVACLVSAPPGSELRGSEDHASVPHCQVFLIHDVPLPAQQAGPLARVLVKEGQLVKQGELLVQVDDTQARLAKASAEAEQVAAQAKADDDIDERFALKSFELADEELRQDLEIRRASKGAVTDAEIRRKQLVRIREQLGIDRARLDRQVAQLTADVKATAVEAAEDDIQRRRIVAPFDGLIVEVLKQEAEWVNSGDAVLRLVRLDRLRVDGFISGAQLNPADVAQRHVTVEIQLAHGRVERFDGQVTFVSPLVNAGNKYRVHAEVANRFERNEPLLRPGMTAAMVIHLR